jgi:hypothetical protein
LFNSIVFTNDEIVAHKCFPAMWLGEGLFFNGRGEIADIAYIDMKLGKDYILDIVIPSCYYASKIYVLDSNRNEFNVSSIEEIVNRLN